MSSTDLISVNQQGAVTWLTLKSEHNRNALSNQLRKELFASISCAISSADVRAIFITHSGPVFSSGFDLTEINPETIHDSLSDLSRILEQIKQSPKPVVTVLNGPAIAGGLGLVAASDFAISLDTVSFSFSEVRIGVSPAIISPYVLAKCQKNVAHEYLLTGKVFSTEIALRMGLINQFGSIDQMPGILSEWENNLLEIEPEAFSITKNILTHMPIQTELINISAELFVSEKARAGREALKEKRRPSWDISGT